MKTENNLFPGWMKAALAAALLVLLAGGAWFYKVQKQEQRRQVEGQLKAIARLKADQIANWRKAQLDAAAVLMDRLDLIADAKHWLTGPTAKTAEEILRRFRSLRKHYRYREVLLVDLDGKVRLSLTSYAGTLHRGASGALAVALRDRKPVFTDLHTEQDDPTPHVSVVAPLFSNHGEAPRPVGAVILVSDAREFLYPMLQSWPVPSQTEETMLVRRDSDDALVLNDIRFHKDAALKLRIPLSRTDVPAVMAVLGKEGFVQGKALRGVDVVAVIKPIPDSPWFMVAEVDAAEAFAVWRFNSVLILALLLGFVALAGAAGLVVWQRNQKAHYRALFQSEAALRASVERHSITLKAIGDAVIATDGQGRVELLNSVAEELTGWKNEEARGKPLEQVFCIVNEETRDNVENPVARVLREGLVVGLANHTLLIARDGTEWPIADSGAPIRDEQGNITGVVLVFRDQTEERRVEEALRESNDYLDNLIDHANAPIIVWEPGFRITRFNHAFEKLTGRTVGDVIGNNLEILFPPALVQSSMQLIKKTLSGERWETVEICILHVDGAVRTVLWNSATIFSKDGITPVATIAQGHDITERKRAEAERERLMAAIEQAGEIVIVTDPDGTIQYVNPAFETVTGYTREEALGQNPRMLKSGKQDEAFYRDLWETISGGRTWKGCLVNKRKDGKLYTEEANISPVCDSSGRVVNYVAVKRDITEHLQLSEQFHQAQKLETVGRLTGGIAHDFNNLLTTIIGNAEMAIGEVGKESPLYESLEDIRGAGERAAGLTRQLLAFSRKQILQPEVVNLNEVVGEMDKLLQRVIGEDIDLETVLAPDLGRVEADIGQIEQVIMNLAVNARDAMPGGGKLTIETANVELDEEYAKTHVAVRPGPYVMLAVSDTGIGMSPEVQAQAFEPFFTTKEKGTGTGLGLSTVYGIVKQSRGNIWVYSEVGRGTSFKIYLPRVDKSGGGEKGKGVRIEARGGTETVLVVEDEDKVRSLAGRVLSRYGYKVLTAGDGQEAVEISKGHEGPIHLLLTDVVMPGMSGRDLAKILERLRPEMKGLYMSGYTDNAIVHHGVLDKGIAFIEKPFASEDLARKVRETLDK